ncbi:MAG: prolyl oligopeptidase family serine peptidase [Candidatus Heimdallarchaeota archaeon]|nr:prolyl oligopeptidase family serine peptidase [Candidatus Heimdallarchaeota archaeon]
MYTLIMLHGFYSSSQSRKIQLLKNLIENDPLTNIGEIITPNLYTSPEEFETMTIPSLVELVISLISQSKYPVILMGSSHGGLIAAIVSSQQPITQLILLAPAIQYKSIIEYRYADMMSQWEEQGFIELSHELWPRSVKWSWEYYQSLPIKISKSLSPILLIHGTSDDVIPVTHSKQFITEQKAHGVSCIEYYLEDGNHSLSNKLNEINEIILGHIKRLA